MTERMSPHANFASKGTSAPSGARHMSPSEAHDSAWQREPGHDEMQLRVMQAAAEWMPTVCVVGDSGDQQQEMQLIEIAAEQRLAAGKTGPSCFVDVLLVYQERRNQTAGPRGYRLRRHFRLLEIKPRIYSAGALLRQLSVLRSHAATWARGDGSNAGRTFDVFPVVRSDDPLAQMLADLGQRTVCTWDGQRIDTLSPIAVIATTPANRTPAA